MKPLKFLFVLAALWMAGSIDVWAAVGSSFTATNENGVAITYKVLTEEGATGTVQVGTGEYSGPAITATKRMEIDGYNYEVFDIPEGELVIPQTVSNGDVTYTVTAIGDYAFYEKGKTLTAISIPSTVTVIGESAFCSSNLESVTLPNELISIGVEAFEYCRALQAIDIPQSVSTIGESCFSSCSQLASVTLHDGNLTQIADDVFTGSGITSIVIPSGVTSIGSSAFSGCHSLQSVTLPDGLTTIGSSAFSYCEVLESLDIPSSVSELGSSFAQYCTQLATVTLHEGNLTEISDYAFWYSGITSINIPEGVTKIGDYAFYNCTSLETVLIPSTMKTLGNNAFNQCNALNEVTFLSEEELSFTFSNWNLLSNIFHKASGKIGVIKLPLGSQFAKNYPAIANQFTSVVEMLMIGTKITVDEHNYRILTLPEGDTNGTVQLGAGFDNPGYGSDAYGEVTIADKITLTNGDDSYTFDVTTLGEGAFSNAYDLGGITIPASITLIKKEAIYSCQNLERVYVKSGTPCTLEEDAFSIKVDEQTQEVLETNCMLVVPAGCETAYQDSSWGSVFKIIKELGSEIDWPQLADDQENHNTTHNKCEALIKPTRWFPNAELYSEDNMWDMPHMMDGQFYVSAFWQSNNSSTKSESLYQNTFDNDYLQLCYNPAFLSPNYGSSHINGETEWGYHDEQPGHTVGGFICFKVKGSGTIIVRGLTESNNAYIGICVPGNDPSYFSGTEEREVSYSYSLENTETEAYAFVYGANLSPFGRHGYIRYIKFVPGGVVNADVSVGGIAIEEESDDVLGDGGSVGFEWREYDEENEGEENPDGARKSIDGGDAEGGEGEPPVQPSKHYYPVLILNNANITSEDGPAIEVNSHERFLIELQGNNTITASNGNAAISMGTLQSEAWGGGTIGIVGLGEGASLTVEGGENGIYLAESSIHMENFSADISGTNYGVHFQGFDPTEDNCNLTLGKGMSLQMQGGQEALSGFNPMSMSNLGYEDEEEGYWISYELLESDLENAQPQWSGVYGIHDGDEWVEDPDDPEGGHYESYDTPAKYLYFGIPPTEVTVNVGTYGMATFCSNYDLNFTDIDNVKAYIVSGFDGINTLTLTRVYEVPAGTGLVLYSTNGGAATATVPIEYTYSYYEQMLVGCNVDKYITPTSTVTITEDEESTEYNYTNFVMSVKNNVAGFYRFTVDDSGKRLVEKGKAYLRLKDYKVPEGEARALYIKFKDDDNDVTGIADNNRETTTNGRYYNLNGQQVDAPQKGLYIRNGKKIVVK